MLSTLLKRKVGNCCIQRPEPNKQNKWNRKCQHQLKDADMTQRTKMTSD